MSKANSDLGTLAKAINVAKINKDAPLITVTGTGCTQCYDQARYELTLDKMGAASGTNLNFVKAGDPWGNKYAIDENEAERPATPCIPYGFGIYNLGSHSGVIVPKIAMYNCS